MTTIDDVARHAGVTRSTVSYALSGKRPISAETRRRVERAIAELDYRPHAGARALASARTHVIGLLAPLRPGVDVNVIMQFVAGVVTGAGEEGYDVLLLTQDDGAISRATRSSMVDALVVMDVEADDPRVPALDDLRQPTVLIGLPRDPRGLSCVDLDFERAGSLAAERLISAGHRRLALLGSPDEVLRRHTSYADRMTRGFTESAARAGATAAVLPTDPSFHGAVASVDRLLAEHPEVTGVVVHNEVALPHVIGRLRELGRRIPDDLSLIAVCPENTAAAQSIALTSVEIPAVAIGRLASEMLIRRLGQGDALPEVRLVSPRIVEGESVRARA